MIRPICHHTAAPVAPRRLSAARGPDALPAVSPRAREAILTLPAAPVACPLARGFVRSMLGHWHLDDIVETAELLVSELVANAVDACPSSAPEETEVRLGIAALPRRLRLEVADQGSEAPCRRDPADDEENGRGLLLVEALADDWGFRGVGRAGLPAGKVVWCEVGIADSDRLPARRVPGPAPLADPELLARVHRGLRAL